MPNISSRRHISALRTNMTRAERALWHAIRDRRLGGYKIRRQVQLGPFIVDFLCAEARLVTEIDGGQHTDERDSGRTAFIQNAGYTVVRFWNNEVNDNLPGVLLTLLERLGAKALTLPSPIGREF